MAEDGRYGAKPAVEVEGRPLAAEVEVLLEQVVVDDHLHLPDMFVLAFRDAGNQVLRQAQLHIGSRVRVGVPGAGSGGGEPLIEGEVTALEAEYDAGGSRAVVRGYDGSHRLHRGRVTQTYQNVKDSDIARTVAQRAGLQPGTIDDSRTTHDHVSQVNLSDWDFVRARAAEIGFEVAVAEGKLHFRRPRPSEEAPAEGDFHSSDPLQLVFGKDLLEFRPRVSSAEQVADVRVRGWDPRAKRAVIGSAPAGTSSVQLPATPGDLAGKFGSPTYVAVDHPLTTQREVDATAKAVAEQIGSAVAEAEGVARGNPRLRAGAAISVGVVADDFVGRYTLTHTRHVFDARGYLTRFEVSGRQDRSLLGLVANANGGAAASAGGGPPVYGVVIAQVTNNDDPEKLGRVKLKFPWLSDGYESDWARMAQMGAGPDSGACFLPEVNDEVLVAFELGDVRRPIVVGGLYNGQDRPRLGDGLIDNGKVQRRGIVSRRGHRLVFLDDPGKSGIALVTAGGSIRIALNETKNEIHVFCQGKVRIEAQDELSISSQQRVSIEAGTQLELKGPAGVKVESSGPVEVSGTPIKLN
ncbi:MAG TPA: VgrG-related protein [Candidatus Dormibacteraeota bacterium]|nr:VgrG-related protein [Candidatus Dormibacteraeota bacterium]